MASCVIPFESMLVQRLEVSNQVDSAFDFRKYLYKSAQNSNGVGGPFRDAIRHLSAFAQSTSDQPVRLRRVLSIGPKLGVESYRA